ncbi:hypothetical protein [Mesorhizobium sp.]|uniref:hypothetical protein n=1 Tax=Mesorhizobium sp. TaxID=1871066 RepID=UPI000FEA8906|nr:hypothetical protein [Mesorhizobium sp.]RWD98337.1 MAG: hypothetical protein EOS40_24465 [Mesorhizobium sp.]
MVRQRGELFDNFTGFPRERFPFVAKVDFNIVTIEIIALPQVADLVTFDASRKVIKVFCWVDRSCLLFGLL